MRVSNENIFLSKDERLNTLRYNNIDYVLKPLDEDFSKSKGGNSNVFLIVDPQTNSEYVIKFSKYNLGNKKIVAKYWDRIARFDREIEALNVSKSNNFDFVVKILFDGVLEIDKNSQFKYFVMEKAESDLTDYLKNTELSVQQRFLICTQILTGIQELHSKEIYHRDIKPDNILIIEGTWKISDLGLIAYRKNDFSVHEIGMKIGPANWMSPEALNKMYNEGKGRTNPFLFDCVLDGKSDIFQLGKLFWFIFQGNIPDGQLVRGDFKIEDQVIYDVIRQMLSHSKNRPELPQIEREFAKRYSAYAI